MFVADVAAEALADGFTRDDIFAGLQYSVIRNYRSRVMGQRRFLERVFFQGKPASNPSLARTLAAVTGREVVVPPDPGAMGAIGIALLARRARLGDRRAEPPARARRTGRRLDLRRVLAARVAERREFRCRDRHCANLCRLEPAEIDVAGERAKVVSGGSCPKYDDVSGAGDKLPKDAPNPYRERDELLARLLARSPTRGRARARRAAGRWPAAARRPVPYAHYLIDTLPFFHTFLARARRTASRCCVPGRHAGRGRPPLRRAGRLRAGQAAARAGDARTSTCSSLPTFVHLPYPNAGAAPTPVRWPRARPRWSTRALRGEGARRACCARCSSSAPATASLRRERGCAAP